MLFIELKGQHVMRIPNLLIVSMIALSIAACGGGGGSSDPAPTIPTPVPVPVPAVNQPPTITLTSPNDADVFDGASAVLSANAADTDGTIASMSFTVTGDGTSVFSDTVTVAPYTVTLDLTNIADGDYVIEATARDDDGAETLVAITIIVDKPEPPPPVNQSPTITFTSPSEGDVLDGASVELSTNP